MENRLTLADFDYELPDELIAQTPLMHRDGSRLLTLGADGAIGHRRFSELPSLLREGDVLVVNDTRVIPARLFGRKAGAGGTLFEFVLLERRSLDTWEMLCRPGRRVRPGDGFVFGGGELRCTITEVTDGGNRIGQSISAYLGRIRVFDGKASIDLAAEYKWLKACEAQ